MKCSRGEIVLLDFPFSDGTGVKLRPAVVVQSDDYNAKLSAVVVAMLTTNTKVSALELTFRTLSREFG